VAPAHHEEIPTAAAAPALQVEIPTVAITAAAAVSSLQADLDTAVGADARSLDLKAVRILPEAVSATWEVHWLREILPTMSRVPDYSEKRVTQKDRAMHV
jgi:hypothetical protein